MSITWIPINDYPGDQQADLDGPFWAEIGTGDGPTTWSWTILANDDDLGVGEVASGTVATEAEAKAAVYEWKPRTAHITHDRNADGTPTRPEYEGECVWNIGLYDPAVPDPDSGYVESMGAATHRGAIAVADAWVNYKPDQVLTAASWVE